jgi:hypothetical protein
VKLGLLLREGHRLRVFENRVLRNIFGPKRMSYQESGGYYTVTRFNICTGGRADQEE